jgi:hypothetical protein
MANGKTNGNVRKVMVDRQKAARIKQIERENRQIAKKHFARSSGLGAITHPIRSVRRVGKGLSIAARKGPGWLAKGGKGAFKTAFKSIITGRKYG